jgi:hypothetical protein
MPSLNFVTVNALNAADRVLIPMQPQIFSAKGLEMLLSTIASVRENLNPNLGVTAHKQFRCGKERREVQAINSSRLHSDYKAVKTTGILPENGGNAARQLRRPAIVVGDGERQKALGEEIQRLNGVDARANVDSYKEGREYRFFLALHLITTFLVGIHGFDGGTPSLRADRILA